MEKIAVSREPKITLGQLPSLPFTYERIFNLDEADYKEWRVSPDPYPNVPKEPRADDEIEKMIQERREGENWFTAEYWRSKGSPEEQIEFQIGNQIITVYSWNKDQPFTDEHIQQARRTFQELASHFPQIIKQLKWVLIDDRQEASVCGDPENYPVNGYEEREWKAFVLLPRGLEFVPHRVVKATNFEGTLAHESAHLIYQQLEPEWRKQFKWAYCWDHAVDWEVKPTPDGSTKRLFNKQTGEMSPQGQFPLQPGQCVTQYAKENMEEDICDSLVAYLFDPDLLQQVSPGKYEIFRCHDANHPRSRVESKRIARGEMFLPAVKPETVYYFIQEPAAANENQ